MVCEAVHVLFVVPLGLFSCAAGLIVHPDAQPGLDTWTVVRSTPTAAKAREHACASMPDKCSSLTILTLDQCDKLVLNGITEQEPEGWNIIIDDILHAPEHRVLSFGSIWQTLRPGDIYVFEDAAVSNGAQGKNSSWYEESVAASLHVTTKTFKRLFRCGERGDCAKMVHNVFGSVYQDVASIYLEDGFMYVHKKPAGSVFDKFPNVIEIKPAHYKNKGKPWIPDFNPYLNNDAGRLDENQVPHLPTLTPGNKQEFPAWHRYYEKVYQQPVTKEVDLNSFSWFYSFAPLPIENIVLEGCFQWHLDLVPYGTVYRFQGCYGEKGCFGQKGSYGNKSEFCCQSCPENIITRKVGFFVRRHIDKRIYAAPTLEVIRTNAGPGAHEGHRCWFYPVVGSGFRVKNRDHDDLKIYMNSPKHLNEVIVPSSCESETFEMYRGTPDNYRRCPNIYGPERVLRFEEDAA